MKIYLWLDGTKINGIYNRLFSEQQVTIDIKEEELEYLKQNALSAYYEDGRVVYKEVEKLKQKQLDEKEQSDILQWLADNDWKVNKVVVGEWSEDDARWIEYKKERKQKRLRLEELQK